MAWIVGVDEAGYGPNLGPLVMSAVACRVPDHCQDADLWQLLHPVVSRRQSPRHRRLVIDDSKLVYTRFGLAGLERGILATLWGQGYRQLATLSRLIEWACPEDHDELRREVWYRGLLELPVHLPSGILELSTLQFTKACAEVSISSWQARSVVVCPSRFNALLDEQSTKGCVLAHALTYLLRWQQATLGGEEAVAVFIDKHGSRNNYAALLQHALPACTVAAEQEGMQCSRYRLHGLGRTVSLTFQPRADSAHLCVALASMVSKYLREVLMLEFNRFWLEHVPNLRPTAGYPMDATRFFQEIRPTIAKLGLSEETLWRRK